MLALFYNSWSNLSNPVTQINKFLLKKYKKGEYWIFYVDKLLRKIGFSDALTLLNQTLPTKSSWKKAVKETTLKIQEESWKAETSEKSSFQLFYPGDYQLDGKLSKLISFQTSPREVASMRMNVRLLIGDYPNNENLYRTKRIDHDYCDYCDLTYSTHNTDSNEHALVTCSLISDKEDLRNQLHQLIKTVCKHSGINAAFQLTNSNLNLHHFIANPVSIINSYLQLPEDQIQSIIVQTQEYLLSCHNEQRKVAKKIKVKKPSKSRRKPDKDKLLPAQADP